MISHVPYYHGNRAKYGKCNVQPTSQVAAKTLGSWRRRPTCAWVQKWQGYRHSGRVPYVKLHHWNLIHTVASHWHVCFRWPQGFLRKKTRVPVRKGRRCKRLKTRTLTPLSKMIAGIVISTRIEHYLDVHFCMWVNCYFTCIYICISYQASDSHFLGCRSLFTLATTPLSLAPPWRKGPFSCQSISEILWVFSGVEQWQFHSRWVASNWGKERNIRVVLMVLQSAASLISAWLCMFQQWIVVPILAFFLMAWCQRK